MCVGVCVCVCVCVCEQIEFGQRVNSYKLEIFEIDAANPGFYFVGGGVDRQDARLQEHPVVAQAVHGRHERVFFIPRAGPSEHLHLAFFGVFAVDGIGGQAILLFDFRPFQRMFFSLKSMNNVLIVRYSFVYVVIFPLNTI